MNNYKLIDISLEQLNDTVISHGQIIRCANGDIFYDNSDGVRIKSSGNLILLEEDIDRENIINPNKNKLYFVIETGTIYRYNSNNKWEDIVYDIVDLNPTDFISEIALANIFNKLLNIKTDEGDILAKVATTGSYNDLTNKPLDLITQTLLNNAISSLKGTVSTNMNTLDKIESIINTKVTISEVNNAINTIIDTAPEALNTLREISLALDNDPDAAANIINLLAAKANSSDITNLIDSAPIDLNTLGKIATEVGTKVTLDQVNTAITTAIGSAMGGEY